MNKTNDFKFNLPAYSDPVDIADLNDNFIGIDDALMAGLCKKEYTGNNMGSSDPSQRKYAWAPWLEIVNDNEFDVVVTDRNAPVESEEATINIAAGQTFRKYINGRYYMNFYVQDQHDVTFKWFTNAETYINESGGGGGGTGTVTSVSVQGGSGSHLTASGNPIETSGTITINIDDGYSIPSDNEQTAWDGKAADLKAEIDSSTYVLTLQLKDSAGNPIGSEKTIDLPLETMVVNGEYDSQTKKIKLELKNGNYVEFSVADLVSGLQTELSASNKLNPAYIAYDASHRAVSDTEKNTWNAKQNAITDLETIRSGAAAGATAVQPATMTEALAAKQDSLSETQLAAVNSGINNTKVQQIGVNQTNILYGLQTGVKNIIQLNPGTYTNNVATFTVSNDGEVVVNSSSAGTSAITIGEFELPAGDYRSWYDNTASDGKCDVRLMNGATRLASQFTLSSATTIHADVYSYAVNSNIVIKPMLCTADAWAQEPNVYRKPALPNSDLTYLEAEDRAALAEEIDSGAKNKFDLSVNYTTISNNITVNKTSNSITVTSQNSGNYSYVSYPIVIDKAGTYVMKATFSDITAGANSARLRLAGSANGDNPVYTLNGYEAGTFSGAFTINTAGTYYMIFSPNWSSSTVVNSYKASDILVCTKAAFCLSNKFVPYNTMAQWTKVEKEYTSTAADTMEYCGISFTVPANQIYEFIVMDRYNAGNPKGLGVADNSTNYNSNSTVIAENMADFSVSNTYPWARQLTGMTVPRSQNTSYYVWVKRGSASKNTIYLMYRRIL